MVIGCQYAFAQLEIVLGRGNVRYWARLTLYHVYLGNHNVPKSTCLVFLVYSLYYSIDDAKSFCNKSSNAQMLRADFFLFLAIGTLNGKNKVYLYVVKLDDLSVSHFLILSAGFCG